MDVFNRFKSTVSNVLPGNPITREFEVGRQVGSAGPGLNWRIYDARKKSTKQDCSVWILEKSAVIANATANVEGAASKLSKSDKEAVCELYRRGVTALTRLKHPRILAVCHPLEESRESLAFASECVQFSLANALRPRSLAASGGDAIQTGAKDNLPESVCAELASCEALHEIEAKYGVLQLAEALAFLHHDCRQLHLNVCPENVAIAASGAWKLAGFEFARASIASSAGGGAAAGGGAEDDASSGVSFWPPNNSSSVALLRPRLEFCAPELLLDARASPNSDMFSLALLIHAVYNKRGDAAGGAGGPPLLQSAHSSSFSALRRHFQQLREGGASSAVTQPAAQLHCVPDKLREHTKLMLNLRANLRPDSLQFCKLPFFDDSTVSVLHNLENLFQLDNLAKSQFYKSLPRVVALLPKRINLLRVFPQLAEEFSNPHMVPFVLPPILQIANLCDSAEFSHHLLAKLIPVFSLAEPIQITMILLQNLSILLAKFPAEQFRNHVLPMLNRALDASDNTQTQELSLQILPSVAHLMEYSTLKNSVIPRLRKIATQTSLLSIRVSCLTSFCSLLEQLDKWFVVDEVLPMLADIKSREPAVLLAVLNMYKTAFWSSKLGITKEAAANRVVPALLAMAIDSNLNLEEYAQFMALIRAVLDKLDAEHRAKLEQLHTLQQEHRSMNIVSAATTLNGGAPPSSSTISNNSQSNAASQQMAGEFGFAAANQSAASAGTLIQPAANYSELSGLNSSNQAARNLSLEEKMRLANQDEQLNRLKSQPESLLVPASAANQRAASGVKDLTHTLIANSNSNAKAGLGGFAAPNYQPFGSAAVQPMGGGGGFAALQSAATNQISFGQSNSQSKPDLSAFDNLFVSKTQQQQQQRQQPMSAMMQPADKGSNSGSNSGGFCPPPPNASSKFPIATFQSPAQSSAPTLTKSNNSQLSTLDIQDFLG